MQVTYTHLDGTTMVYTANTAIPTKQYLGNSVVGYTSAEHLANLRAAASSTTTKYILFNGVPNTPATIYYVDTQKYITDYGISSWAQERLTREEYNTYLSQVETWSANATGHHDNPYFMAWWKKYTSDPNVTVQN